MINYNKWYYYHKTKETTISYYTLTYVSNFHSSSVYKINRSQQNAHSDRVRFGYQLSVLFNTSGITNPFGQVILQKLFQEI